MYSQSLLFLTKILKPEKVGLLFWNLQEGQCKLVPQASIMSLA